MRKGRNPMAPIKGRIAPALFDNESKAGTDEYCCTDSYIGRSVDIDTAEAVLPTDEAIYKVTEIFSALADSTRFKILASLVAGELCVCELTEVCEVSQSAVSHQLRLLRDRGLVRSHRAGQRVVYHLADEHVLQLIRIGIEHATELTGPEPEGRQS